MKKSWLVDNIWNFIVSDKAENMESNDIFSIFGPPYNWFDIRYK